MDILVIILIAGVVMVAFYAALRLYTRRRVAHGDKPVDTD
jgi:hypothetical protein